MSAPNSVPRSAGKEAIQMGCGLLAWLPLLGGVSPESGAHRVCVGGGWLLGRGTLASLALPSLSPVFTGAAHKSWDCANGPWPVSL